jgi:hypothetical protein
MDYRQLLRLSNPRLWGRSTGLVWFFNPVLRIIPIRAPFLPSYSAPIRHFKSNRPPFTIPHSVRTAHPRAHLIKSTTALRSNSSKTREEKGKQREGRYNPNFARGRNGDGYSLQRFCISFAHHSVALDGRTGWLDLWTELNWAFIWAVRLWLRFESWERSWREGVK